ncbi:MAG: hypothetical protein H0V56_13295 [Chthoniobacterales bacterium]|nr:hypothetical protein [Chthoniobacterales bacterium]
MKALSLFVVVLLTCGSFAHAKTSLLLIGNKSEDTLSFVNTAALKEMIEILRGQEQHRRAEAKRRLDAAIRASKAPKGRKIIGRPIRENIGDPLVQKALEGFGFQTASENVIPPSAQPDPRTDE